MEQSIKWLRWALIAGIFAVPFIPFIVSTSYYFPFITGKNFTFRILIDLLFAAYLILAMRDPHYRPRFSWMSVGVCVLFCVAILSTITSIDPVKSFWSNFERMEGLVGLAHLVIWFYLIGAVLSTEKLWERFLQVSVGASFIMGVYVLFQHFGELTINQGGVRTDGTFGNAIYLAVYMLFHIFFTLLLMARHQGQKWVHALYGVALVLQGIALYYTATRSATLGFLGGLLVVALGLVFFEKNNKRLRTIAFCAVGTLVVLVGGFLTIRNASWVAEDPVLTRFASISTSDGTFQSRLMIWNMAAQGVMEHPILGWGFDNFNFVFNKYYNPEMWAQEQWFDRAHNAFIDWAVAGGLLGLLAFIALFVLAFIAFLRAQNLSVLEKSILIGLLAAYGFHSLFVFDNLMSSVYFFVLLALAHAYSKTDLPRAMFLTRPMRDGLLLIVAPVTTCVVLIGAYTLNVPGMKTASSLIEAMTPTKVVTDASGKKSQVQKNPTENLASFVVATESSSLGRQEVVEQLLQLASTAATTSGIDPSVRDSFVKLATEKGTELLAMRPNDARLELFYGSFLNLAGKAEAGREHLLRAHELSPNKQTIAFELGINAYLRSGDLANSLAVLKRAYDSAPEYPEAAKYYAMALMYAGKQADADAVLTKTFGTVFVDDDRMIGVYTDGKMFDRVVGIWEVRIKKDPTSPQHRASLAEAYKNAGSPSQAIATLRQALKDFPQYTAQINDVAKQLGLTL